jgi:hypothetical protein
MRSKIRRAGRNDARRRILPSWIERRQDDEGPIRLRSEWIDRRYRHINGIAILGRRCKRRGQPQRIPVGGVADRGVTQGQSVLGQGAGLERERVLQDTITRVWHEDFCVYGVRKTWRLLNRESIAVARCTAARLMGKPGLNKARSAGRSSRRRSRTNRRRGRWIW